MAQRNLRENDQGSAVVEATILFPIMMMIFAGLVLLAMYLPTRANLQRATQYAATAISVQESDSWLFFDETAMDYQWETDRNALTNVYVQFFGSLIETQRERGEKESLAKAIVKDFIDNGFILNGGEPDVTCVVRNYVIYKEVAVTATHTIQLPVDLTFVGLARDIPITVTSTAIVLDGDGFLRNVDMTTDFVDYLNKKYNLGLDKLGESLNKVWDFMGIK